MPKFTYSAAKGIEQSSGSGFFVNGAPMVEHQQTVDSVASDGAANAINTYGATTINLSAGVSNATAALADGSYIGQMKHIAVGTDGAGGAAFAVTIASFSDGSTGLAFDDAGEAVTLVWLGSTVGWKVLLNTGSTGVS